ncbi:MAG TPA: hypothetical protein VNP95_01960 [Thermomicrobiales bacterium]|nr:hypothetical protein [Thermomicrobiales bacterium]
MSKVDRAREVTGDNTIISCVTMRPAGTVGSELTGLALGGLASEGNASDMALGGTVGQVAAAGHEDLPLFVSVAVSPARVYLLRSNILGMRMHPFAEIDRDHLVSTVSNLHVVIAVTLQDTSTNKTYTLEIPRTTLEHVDTVLDLLRMGPEHVQPSDDEDATTPATA